MKFIEARRTVQALGFSLTRTGYGHEVVLRRTGRKDDPAAYYTDDNDDAVNTARLLNQRLTADRGQWRGLDARGADENGWRLRVGRELTRRGGYGMDRQLQTMDSTPAVYWSPQRGGGGGGCNSYVAYVRVSDGRYGIASINGLGEIRWTLDLSHDGWQGDADAAGARDYFFER